MARLTPIRFALLQENRTQRWLADELGKSEQVTSRIVNGLVPDDSVIENVCRLLGRDASVLFPHVSREADQANGSSTPSSELAA